MICDATDELTQFVWGAYHLQQYFNLFAQLLVLSQVDRVLDEVDWLIARKKSQSVADKPDSGRKFKR